MEGFRVEDFLGEFLKELKTLRPELTETLDREYPSIDSQKESAYFTDVYRPIALEIIQKDVKLFETPRFFLRGIDFSTFFEELNAKKKASVWNFLRTGLVASYIGEDWVKTLKEMWSKYTGKEQSEIDEILGDSSTKGSIEELFEFFKETRIFKLGLEMVENLKLEQFGVEELDMTDPAALLSMLKDPNHPFMQRAVGVVGAFVENKIKNGSLKKEDLVRELEMIREKFKHSLGKVFKESIFGESPRDTQRAEVLLSSNPDARRARMVARLQRKLRDRKP
jgi:hypothetical protein